MSDYSTLGDMQHCTIPLPKPQVGPLHPFNNDRMHDKLLSFVQQRLLLGKDVRDTDLHRLVRTDKKVAGWMKLGKEDKLRAQTQDREGKPVITNINLPLAWVHLDDMMTYFAATFAPNRGMFYQNGAPDEQDDASQIVTKMNNDAIQSGAYRETLLGLFALLKYNKGGYWCNWSSESGPTLVQTDLNTQPQVQMEVKWSGNKMTAVDNYNFLYDASVPLHKLHTDGEFAAHADIRSYYWLQSRAGAGVYYNLGDYLSNPASQIGNNMAYYRNPPQQAQFDADNANGVDSSGTNWVSILSESSGYVKANGYEVVTCYIRLNPTEFALVAGKADVKAARNRYEVWRITILNDERIIGADYMNNIHGYLPVFVGTMNDDVMGAAQRSAAEILTPLQDFASFLVNTHVAGARKNLYGTTFFDPTMVDLDQIPQGEVAARVKVKPAAYGKDIRTYLFQMSASGDTNQTLQDLDGVMNLVNQFFPTQSLPSQIASIDRAVDSQVAAVQQGANRRQQKAARQIDDSIFRNVRFAMYYNIIQFATDNEQITDAFTGKTVTIDLSKLRSSNLPYIIGQGLKAIDRMAAASMLQQIIFALIQAPAAAQGLDILGLIDYWTSMIDIDINMKQFRIAPPPQPGAPGADTQQVDAAGNPISPATNPQSVTAPLTH